MRDKNDTPLAVGDLVYYTYRSSAGHLYRIEEITDFPYLTAWQKEENRTQRARCVGVYDRLLTPRPSTYKGHVIAGGDNFIKVDEKFASQMANRWNKLASECKN